MISWDPQKVQHRHTELKLRFYRFQWLKTLLFWNSQNGNPIKVQTGSVLSASCHLYIQMDVLVGSAASNSALRQVAHLRGLQLHPAGAHLSNKLTGHNGIMGTWVARSDKSQQMEANFSKHSIKTGCFMTSWALKHKTAQIDILEKGRMVKYFS